VTNINSPFSVENSVDLAKKIQAIDIPLDRSMLKPYTPVRFCRLRLLVFSLGVIPAVAEVCPLMCANEFFSFPKDIGVPIGSPLGAMIDEAFMSKLEENLILSSHDCFQHIVYWHRYVDDVLCLWNSPETALQLFLSLLNSRYTPIEFTTEKGGNSINLLDLSISINRSRHDFGIYRKDTF